MFEGEKGGSGFVTAEREILLQWESGCYSCRNLGSSIVAHGFDDVSVIFESEVNESCVRGTHGR